MTIRSLSFSSLNAWALCPERWRRAYLEGERLPPGIAAHRGKGLHKSAEYNFMQKITSGEDEPLSVLQDVARDSFMDSARSGTFVPLKEKPSFKKDMAKALDLAVKVMTKAYRESLAPNVQPALVEKKITLDLPPLPVPFTCILDVYTNDRWWLDIKSSGKKWPEAKGMTDLQATVNWALLKAHLGEEPVKMSYEIFTPATHQSLEVTRGMADVHALIQRSQSMLACIQAGNFGPCDPNSWVCSPKWCGYFWTCKYIPITQRNRREQ